MSDIAGRSCRMDDGFTNLSGRATGCVRNAYYDAKFLIGQYNRIYNTSIGGLLSKNITLCQDAICVILVKVTATCLFGAVEDNFQPRVPVNQCLFLPIRRRRTCSFPDSAIWTTAELFLWGHLRATLQAVKPQNHRKSPQQLNDDFVTKPKDRIGCPRSRTGDIHT